MRRWCESALNSFLMSLNNNNTSQWLYSLSFLFIKYFSFCKSCSHLLYTHWGKLGNITITIFGFNFNYTWAIFSVSAAYLSTMQRSWSSFPFFIFCFLKARKKVFQSFSSIIFIPVPVFFFAKPLNTDLWIIQALKKIPNSGDEAMSCLHIIDKLAKNQF